MSELSEILTRTFGRIWRIDHRRFPWIAFLHPCASPTYNLSTFVLLTFNYWRTAYTFGEVRNLILQLKWDTMYYCAPIIHEVPAMTSLVTNSSSSTIPPIELDAIRNLERGAWAHAYDIIEEEIPQVHSLIPYDIGDVKYRTCWWAYFDQWLWPLACHGILPDFPKNGADTWSARYCGILFNYWSGYVIATFGNLRKAHPPPSYLHWSSAATQRHKAALIIF
jgi:hypothetical protein